MSKYEISQTCVNYSCALSGLLLGSSVSLVNWNVARILCCWARSSWGEDKLKVIKLKVVNFLGRGFSRKGM